MVYNGIILLKESVYHEKETNGIGEKLDPV